MIDETDVIKYERTDAELFEFLLFCIFVANKSAAQTARKLDTFLGIHAANPKKYITHCILKDTLEIELRNHKIGQYTRISDALRQSVHLNLRTCTREDLLKIKGIGMKTASYFLACTRKNEHYLVLNTHVTKFLNHIGLAKSTNMPTKKNYLKLEEKYLAFCDEHKLSSTDFDLEVWKYYSGNKSNLKEICQSIGVTL